MANNLTWARISIILALGTIAGLLYVFGPDEVKNSALAVGSALAVLTAVSGLFKHRNAETPTSTAPSAPAEAQPSAGSPASPGSARVRLGALAAGICLIIALSVMGRDLHSTNLTVSPPPPGPTAVTSLLNAPPTSSPKGPTTNSTPTDQPDPNIPQDCSGKPAWVYGTTPTRTSFDLNVRICQPPASRYGYWLMSQRKEVYQDYDAYVILYPLADQPAGTTRPYGITITSGAILTSQRILYVVTAPLEGGSGVLGYRGNTAQWVQQNMDNQTTGAWDNYRHQKPTDVVAVSNSFTHTVG